MIYFIDTCVPMYSIGREHNLKIPCAFVLHCILNNYIQTFTSVNVFQEMLHRYKREKKLKIGLFAFDYFLKTNISFLPINLEDIYIAR